MSKWFYEEVTYGGAHLGYKIDKVLCEEKSDFQTIMIFENKDFGRVMTIDDITMLTTREEFVYHEMITHPAFAVNPNIKRVLVIGAGDGGTIRELVKHNSVEKIDWIEIDGKVIELSEKYLPTLSCANHDPRVNIMVIDGVKYVKEYDGEKYDLIIVDSTDPIGPGEGLFGTEFYTNCNRILSDEGIVINQAENPHYSAEWVQGIYKKLTNIFPIASVYQAFIPMYPSGHWLFGFASKKYQPLDIKEEPLFVNELKYYNKEVHKAAFALPNFVKKLLEDALKQ